MTSNVGDDRLDWHTQYQFELDRANKFEQALAKSRKEVEALKKDTHRLSRDTHRLTRLQAAIISAYTGYLACSFETMQEYAEELLGRKIAQEEFSDTTFIAALHFAAKPDFLEIAFKEK